MSLEEVAAIRGGPDSPVWEGKEEDSAVLRAVDELRESSQIADETWDALKRHFDKHQIMDLVFTIGNYVMLAWSINAFGMDRHRPRPGRLLSRQVPSGRRPLAHRSPTDPPGLAVGRQPVHDGGHQFALSANPALSTGRKSPPGRGCARPCR